MGQPFQFSMRWAFGVMSFCCGTAWIVGLYLNAVVNPVQCAALFVGLGVVAGGAYGWSCGKPIIGSIIGLWIAIVLLNVICIPGMILYVAFQSLIRPG